MFTVEKKFADNLREIVTKGQDDVMEKVRPVYADNTPAHSRYITQVFEKYDIDKGELPITCLRPIAWKSGIREILWIYRDASNDLNLLAEKYNVRWWDSWDIGDRTIGQCYGAVVARHDLMNRLLKGLCDNPFGRRHILNLWQYEDLEKPHGLDPCAYETLWSVRRRGEALYLDMSLIQRSSDYPVAGHINKMQYTALMMMVARHCGFLPGCFSHFVQNLHIYDRHLPQARELLRRFEEAGGCAPRLSEDSPLLAVPRLLLNPEKKSFYDMTPEDFTLEGYHPMEQMKLELAI